MATPVSDNPRRLNADHSLKSRMLAGDILAGTFVKTPAHEVVEVLAMSGLDFIALDAEHAPFDRGRLDSCLAIARALDFPVLVRVPSGEPAEILKVLDSGATGIIVPHVDKIQKAQDIARCARFGHGGRGYAGSTRWAGFATRPMSDILQQSLDETVVIAQVEEPEGVELASDIAAVSGIDGLFVGPADLSVCLGTNDINSTPVRDAMRHVGEAAASHGKAFMTFAPTTASAAELNQLGVTMFFIASEHAFMLAGARESATALHALAT
ncbi:MAG: aldolase [Granulosicoccus sp.]|nr:aldolase [Granulosicoccus sp.]